MPFLLLLMLYLACLGGPWPRPPGLPETAGGVLLATLFTWSAVGLLIGAAAGAAWRVQALLRRNVHDRDTILRRYSRFRSYHTLALFGVYGVSLYVLGWGWGVRRFATIPFEGHGVFIPGGELLLLAPLVAGLVLSWAFYYQAERALYQSVHPLMMLRPFWSRAGYLGFNIRMNLAVILVPGVVLIAFNGIVRLNPDLVNHTWFMVLGGAALILLILCLPWILRVVLGLTPLPAGELRDRLLALAKRLNFRCSDILVWNTHNGVANALVMGAVPALRYVTLSDRLMADLTTDELEAVFGHEAGHVKHHHMLYYMGFLLLSLAVLAGAWDLARPYLFPGALDQDLFIPMLLGSVGMYIFLVFGFLSRRCERQADIYGCRAISCGRPDCPGHEETPLPAGVTGICPTGIRTFVHALEKVACLSGISRSKPGLLQSWRHSTIARRVQFLENMAVDPTLEPRFQRRVGLVKWALILVLAGLLGALRWAPVGAQAEEPPGGASVETTAAE